ncbi:MAG: cytochrome b, partial [Hymenobacter sp.]
MRLSKLNAILRASTSNLQDSATPSSISYAYNFGSLLGLLFGIMLVTGILLAMHYIGSASTAFGSVAHIMSDVSNGYYLRYTHANGASFVFIALYCHIIRNLYYSSYKAPRSGTWLVGNLIIVLAIGTAFLGYSLVYGQMSLWGATVISNLATAVPFVGFDIATILWGAYSVGSSTLTRFFALHYALAIFVIVLAVTHLLLLHMHASSSPTGIAGSYDKIAMQPLFLVKDSVTILLTLAAFAFIAAQLPNMLGHSDNYIEANSLATPASIVPEWYLLPYYAILRSVPSKLIGVALMLAAIIWLAAMVFDTSILRSHSFKLVARTLLTVGFFAFIVLLSLGAKHIESPYVVMGQVSTVVYFGALLFGLPSAGLIENASIDISANDKAEPI